MKKIFKLVSMLVMFCLINYVTGCSKSNKKTDIIGTWECTYKFSGQNSFRNLNDEIVSTLELYEGNICKLTSHNITKKNLEPSSPFGDSSYSGTYEFADGIVTIKYEAGVTVTDAFKFDSSNVTLTQVDEPDHIYHKK